MPGDRKGSGNESHRANFAGRADEGVGRRPGGLTDRGLSGYRVRNVRHNVSTIACVAADAIRLRCLRYARP